MKFLNILVLLQIAVLFSAQLNAQSCQPGQSCFDAPLLCGNELDGFNGITGPSNDITQPDIFCGIIENNQWIRFVACATEVVLELEVSNCAGTLTGSGLQAEIFATTDCSVFNSVSDCFNPNIEASGNINAFGLTPGSVYYLMIDGWAGDICNYKINVITGVDTNPPEPEVLSSGYILGSASVCPGEQSLYEVVLPQCANVSPSGCPLPSLPPSSFSYDWNLPPGASIVSEKDAAKITILWGETSGSVSVQVTESTFSDCDCKWTCPEIIPDLSVIVNTVPTQTDTLPKVILCEGDTYEFCGQIYTTTIDAVCSFDCVEATIQPIEFLPASFEDLGNISLCPNECFTLDGVDFCETGFYTSTDADCQKVGFNVVEISIEGFYTPSGILNPRDTIVTLEGGASSNNGTVSFEWTGPGITDDNKNQQNPDVREPGLYVLTVTDTESGCTFEIPVAVLYSTTSCNLPAPPTDSCSLSPLLCGASLDGYCSFTGAFEATLLGNIADVFCAPIENNSWLRFVPCEDEVVFEIETKSCMSGQGIELAVFATDDCEQFVLKSNCVNIVESNIDALTVSQLTPGEIYYLMVDGIDGADCEWGINIISGISVESIRLEQSSEPSLVGLQNVCRGDIVKYTAIPADCNITGGDGCPYNSLLDSLTINWKLPDGATLLSGEGQREIEVRWDGGSGGEITVEMMAALADTTTFCLTTNGCGSFASLNVAVDFTTVYLPTVELCKGDCFEFCGVTYCETIDAVCADDCGQTIQPIIIYEASTNDLGEISLCQGDCYEYKAIQYCDEGFFELEEMDGPCVDIVKFQIIFKEEAELQISEVIEDCDAFGSTYQIVFEITNGIAPFFVNGLFQDQPTFTSSPIFSGEIYQYEITHSAICDYTPILIEGEKNCACQTFSGTMQADLLVNCEDEEVQAMHHNNEFLDADDAFEYVLHEGDSAELIKPLAINLTGKFSFLPDRMEYGKIYYISYVAGNAIDGGFVDLNAICLSISIGQPVVFYDKAILEIGDEITLTCKEAKQNLNAIILNNNERFVYEWTGPNAFYSKELNPLVTQDGEYIFSVIDTISKCQSSASQKVNTDFALPEFTALEDTLNCYSPEIRLQSFANSNNINLLWISPNNDTLSTSNPMIKEVGVYTLLATGENGCEDSKQIEIANGFHYPSIIAEGDTLTCNQSVITLSVISDSEELIYEWTSPDGQKSVKPSLNVSLAGAYQLSLTDLISGCISDTILSVEDALAKPQIIIEDADKFTCEQTVMELSAINTLASQQLNYNWSSPNNSPIDNNKSASPLIYQAGKYYLTTNNIVTGCFAKDSITVAQEENVPEDILFQLSPPICHDDSNAIVLILDVVGGFGPYEYAFEEQAFSNTSFWQNLNSGTYSIEVKDKNDCIYNKTITIANPPEIAVDLGEDISINLGDEINLEAIVSIPYEDLGVVNWQRDRSEINIKDLAWHDQPFYTSIYSITVADENNCMDEDEILVRVNRELPVYIPNAFSPNNDDINDVFSIHTGDAIAKINSIQIYNRWGTLVYEIKDIPTNDTRNAWDGVYRGQLLNNAVFVYLIELETIEGERVIYTGDVSLIR